MASKRPEINRFAEAFAQFYHNTLSDYAAESLALGKSIRQIYAYADYRDPGNMLKAHEVPYSTIAREVLHFLQQQLEHPQFELNGSIDDEWAHLAELFAEIRQRFTRGQRFDYTLAERFKAEMEHMFAEWKQRG